ncbi:hypothetical protein TNCV_678801 [Trichonephila clavipes]|nr:hypothetical protein TNCV_678801 [Trichonephila clavipes]
MSPTEPLTDNRGYVMGFSHHSWKHWRLREDFIQFIGHLLRELKQCSTSDKDAPWSCERNSNAKIPSVFEFGLEKSEKDRPR